MPMPRTPNYNFERKERDRLKAEKKAEKLAAKAKRKEDTGKEESEKTEDAQDAE
jgi:hypothetical protein